MINDQTQIIIPETTEESLPPKEVTLDPLSIDDVKRILGLTIKRDEINRVLTFLALLSTYTEDSQMNVSFNAPSSTGKSYIPQEISHIFPTQDVIEIGYVSPTAFFHDVGKFDKSKEGYIVDLSKKILIFMDQPHTLLLQHLRPLLSHDKKEIEVKITDKSQKAGLRTKNVFLIGYPTVIFCTAGLKLDEQEATRFLMLSPEVNQEKLRESIIQKINKESDKVGFNKTLDDNLERVLLKARIVAIKDAHIREIKIESPQLIEELFMKDNSTLKPRHQRDIGRITSLIKSLALLNLWDRKRDEDTLYANDDDIRDAFELWHEISVSQDLGLPPYIYNFYQDIVVGGYTEKNSESGGGVKIGLSTKEILKIHYTKYGRNLPGWQLGQEYLPMLETAGLIYMEDDPKDKRCKLYYPTM